jgi:methylated-DNA-[protein]-cysteine S-methyltransferase
MSEVWTAELRLPAWSARVAATPAGLCYLSLSDRDEGGVRRFVAAHLPGETVREAPDRLRGVAEALEAYFEGRLRRFNLPLDLRGTPFQLAVWRELLRLPYGTTSTYGAIARALGRPRAARAVGQAVGANPVAVVVPCHRVLGAGRLGGYAGGVGLKRRLLALEGILPAA